MTKKNELQKTISAKQYGRNLILIIDGEKHSKAFEHKVDRENILAEVEKYNFKNTKASLSRIEKAMKKEDKKAIFEKLKKKNKFEDKKPVKATSKKATKSQMQKAKEVNEQEKANVAKTSPYTYKGKREW